jgi:hypothetical protein
MTNTIQSLDHCDLSLVTGGNGDGTPQPQQSYDWLRTARAAGEGCLRSGAAGAIVGGLGGMGDGWSGVVTGAVRGAATGCVRGAIGAGAKDAAAQTGFLR